MWMDEIDSESLNEYVSTLQDRGNQYGYGPTHVPPKFVDSVTDYDDASKYGYEDARPSVKNDDSNINLSQPCHKTKSPRRSSMKKQGSHRRASIGSLATAEMEINIRGQAEPVRRKRSIDFEETSEVRHITPISCLADEPKTIWFQKDEFRMMRYDRDIIVELMKRGQKEGDDFCGRGLERFVESRSFRRQTKNACVLVLLEQEDQQVSGNFNEHRISKLYQNLTRHSQKQAAERAARDAAAIKEYTYSPTSFHHRRRVSC